jgi:hypothetical protein
MSIDKIILDYEKELMIMINNNYPKEIINPQFFNYQRYYRDNYKVKNDYETIKPLVFEYLRKEK